MQPKTSYPNYHEQLPDHIKDIMMSILFVTIMGR